METAPAAASSAGLVETAFSRGLYLSTVAAASFAESVARKLLAESGYSELKQKLRTRAPPQPVAGAIVRGSTLGTSELPGPQPAMPPVERQPAEHSPSPSPEPSEDGDVAQASGEEDGDAPLDA